MLATGAIDCATVVTGVTAACLADARERDRDFLVLAGLGGGIAGLGRTVKDDESN